MAIIRKALGGGSEGKGRHGYFKAVEVEASLQGPERLRLDVYSKIRGDVAPLTLILTAEDAKLLAGIFSDFADKRPLF